MILEASRSCQLTGEGRARRPRGFQLGKTSGFLGGPVAPMQCVQLHLLSISCGDARKIDGGVLACEVIQPNQPRFVVGRLSLSDRPSMRSDSDWNHIGAGHQCCTSTARLSGANTSNHQRAEVAGPDEDVRTGFETMAGL